MQLSLPQFTVKTLLLATAFIGIVTGGALTWAKIVMADFEDLLLDFVQTWIAFSPLWVPLIFLGHWIGRRKLSVVAVVVFGVCEGIASPGHK